MHIDAGELNERIEVFEVALSEHEEGYLEYSERPVLKCWAKCSKASGSTLVKTNASFAEEKIRFLIRYTLKRIKRKMMIRCAGVVYEIEYVNGYDRRRYMELWAKRVVMDSPQTVTLYNSGETPELPNMTVLTGVFVDRIVAADVSHTGLVNGDVVKLYIPLSVSARNALTGEVQHYLSPKKYRAKEDKNPYWTIDSSAGLVGCFFACGELDEQGKYQDINAKYDDVYRVKSTTLRNFGSLNAVYLEVEGR